MSESATSPDGVWRIRYERHDRDSLFDSDTRESWEIIHIPTGQCVKTFHGSDNMSASSWSQRGIESVRFADDGKAVVATPYEGEPKRVPLRAPKPQGGE